MDKFDLSYVDPWESDLKKIDDQWTAYLLQGTERRHMSDLYMLQFLDTSNEDIYRSLRVWLLNLTFYMNDDQRDAATIEQTTISEGNYEAAYQDMNDGVAFSQYTKASNVDTEEHDNIANMLSALVRSPEFPEKVELAQEWERQTGFVIMIPSAGAQPGLQNKFDAWNMMLARHRDLSDRKSIELFGAHNIDIYKFELGKVADEDIGEDSPDTYSDEAFSERAFCLTYCDKLIREETLNSADLMVKFSQYCRSTGNLVMDSCRRYAVQESLTMYRMLHEHIHTTAIDLLSIGDLPYYSPDEMIDLGVFNHGNPEMNAFGPSAPETLLGGEFTPYDWFVAYQEVFYGMPITDKFRKMNEARVQTLTRLIGDGCASFSEGSIKQMVLELGWNPYVNFRGDARNLALGTCIKSMGGAGNYVHDFSAMNYENYVDKHTIQQINEARAETNEEPLFPIFLVFQEGDTPVLSRAIKVVTKGPYSHAAISFDPSLKQMYSFGMDGSDNALGGLTRENIDRLRAHNPELQIGQFCVFVTEEIYNKIKSNVEWFIENSKKTMYHFAGLLTILFQIPNGQNKTLICSEFVDKMLKLGSIDITGKASSMVDPNYLRRCSKSRKDIFKIFEGKLKNFRPGVSIARINALNKATNRYKGNLEEASFADPLKYYKKNPIETNIAFAGDPFVLEMIYRDFCTPKELDPANKMAFRIYEAFYGSYKMGPRIFTPADNRLANRVMMSGEFMKTALSELHELSDKVRERGTPYKAALEDPEIKPLYESCMSSCNLLFKRSQQAQLTRAETLARYETAHNAMVIGLRLLTADGTEDPS